MIQMNVKSIYFKIPLIYFQRKAARAAHFEPPARIRMLHVHLWLFIKL